MCSGDVFEVTRDVLSYAIVKKSSCVIQRGRGTLVTFACETLCTVVFDRRTIALSSLSRPKGGSMSPKTQVAISFMEDNLHRPIPIEEIARLVKLSRSRLCYLFKAEAGLAPTQYLKKVRMEKALKLLQTSFMSIKEVAAKVGYNDSTHSMREFKKAYGSTPSQHRAGYRSDGAGKDES